MTLVSDKFSLRQSTRVRSSLRGITPPRMSEKVPESPGRCPLRGEKVKKSDDGQLMLRNGVSVVFQILKFVMSRGAEKCQDPRFNNTFYYSVPKKEVEHPR
jgi:hypothetical protein